VLKGQTKFIKIPRTKYVPLQDQEDRWKYKVRFCDSVIQKGMTKSSFSKGQFSFEVFCLYLNWFWNSNKQKPDDRHYDNQHDGQTATQQNIYWKENHLLNWLLFCWMSWRQTNKWKATWSPFSAVCYMSQVNWACYGQFTIVAPLVCHSQKLYIGWPLGWEPCP